MDTLSQEDWDVVIAGTGLSQALLALSLSRSGLKVLHVDRNQYYGSLDAGLSIDEAEKWVTEHEGLQGTYSNASVHRSDSPHAKLAPSRAYTLSLRPQIIYATSSFLPLLVTSRVHDQLEFLAVGSHWTYKDGKLQRVPSTREDVFADGSLPRRDKVGLMKFLRHVLQDEDAAEGPQLEVEEEARLRDTLSSKFKISPVLQPPIAALTLLQQPTNEIRFDHAVQRIRRHMRSMNYFGPGFAAVYAKYAGNAEIAQVACRAGAVGGSVYLLGHGIESVQEPGLQDNAQLWVTLTGGTVIKSKRVVSGQDDLPPSCNPMTEGKTGVISHLCQIAIVSTPLRHLFPSTSDSGPNPAVAVVLADDTGPVSATPVYLQIHSSDTGECPVGQCCIYASARVVGDETQDTTKRISSAIDKLLSSHDDSDDLAVVDDENPKAILLWSMTYACHGLGAGVPYLQSKSGQTLVFPARPYDVAFDDAVLDSVKTVWQKVVGDAATGGEEAEFMVFPERRQDDM